MFHLVEVFFGVSVCFGFGFWDVGVFIFMFVFIKGDFVLKECLLGFVLLFFFVFLDGVLCFLF